MDDQSYRQMQKFVDGLDRDKLLTILDVGSLDINGTYRPMVEAVDGWKYVGLDVLPGPNVDVVSEEPCCYPLDAGSVDVIISGQTLEHVRQKEDWVRELHRLLAPDGMVCVIAPWRWMIHSGGFDGLIPNGLPDYWRILPDGMRYLLELPGFEVLEVYTTENHCVGIARKNGTTAEAGSREITVVPKTEDIDLMPIAVDEPLRFSVFTPTHRGGNRWFREAWEGLKAQTYANWQWVVVPNNGATIPENIANDSRVYIVPFTGKSLPDGRNSVGALKRFACERCSGDVYVELDDDDILTPDALQSLAEAYADPGTQMAYSNAVGFEDGTWESRTYSAWWGWQVRPYRYNGYELEQLVAWPPGPWSLRRIYWSPNHLRSWRAAAYHAIGGHDPALSLVDDHDMNIRSYLAYGARGLRHIDECLYLYRIHGESTNVRFASVIRRHDQECYDKYVVKMAMRWARDEGLAMYDLGGGIDPQPGFASVDNRPADVRCDLRERWPFNDDSVGVIRANHVVEHLPDPIHTMNEAFRVLAPGGWAFIEVPSTDGRGAWQDPTHVSFWNENSFCYYTREDHARYIRPQFEGRFQVSELKTYFPNADWEAAKIPVVRAHLIALKPGYEERRAGEILI